MWVSLIKENLQIYWLKMILFKYFELYVHTYTSDYFNEKRFCCSELPQADSREDARLVSSTPQHSSLDAYSRLTNGEVASLLARLQCAVVIRCWVKTLCVTFDSIWRALHSREKRFSRHTFSLRSRLRKSASSTVSVYVVDVFIDVWAYAHRRCVRKNILGILRVNHPRTATHSSSLPPLRV